MILLKQVNHLVQHMILQHYIKEMVEFQEAMMKKTMKHLLEVGQELEDHLSLEHMEHMDTP